MTYLSFTENLLNSFPRFREYFLHEEKANETELLPSLLPFELFHYYDKLEGLDDSEIKDIVNFLSLMEHANDEDLRMLYNESMSDLGEFPNLQSRIFEVKKFGLVDPYNQPMSKEDIRADIQRKKETVEERSKQYEENNKLLLQKYRNNNE